MSDERDERLANLKKFAEFATECGLKNFPMPCGERYLYAVEDYQDGYACKKGEYVEFMDVLWNALARAKGRDDLTLGR